MMAILPSIWHLMNMKQRGVQFPSLSSLAVSTTLDNYYNFAFRTNSTTLCDLTHPMALSILLVLVLMIRTRKEILLPKLSLIGRNIGRATHGDEWERNNSDRIVKFGEYLYRLFYHTVLRFMVCGTFTTNHGVILIKEARTIFGLIIQIIRWSLVWHGITWYRVHTMLMH